MEKTKRLFNKILEHNFQIRDNKDERDFLIKQLNVLYGTVTRWNVISVEEKLTKPEAEAISHMASLFKLFSEFEDKCYKEDEDTEEFKEIIVGTDLMDNLQKCAEVKNADLYWKAVSNMAQKKIKKIKKLLE